jgi:twinkle protein
MSTVRRTSDFYDNLVEYSKNDFGRDGFLSGITCIDEFTVFRKGMLAVFTGHSGSGKSELVDQLCMQWAMLHGFKTLFFSPENAPLASHAKKHIERYFGKSIRQLKPTQIKEGCAFIDDYFGMIDLGEEEVASIDMLLEVAKKEMKERPFDIIVFDPWNECDFGLSDREDLYISKKITQIKKFLRANKTLGIIVAHPRTPREKVTDDKGRMDYPPPKLHEISGGGNWKNKCDWGISCHRHPEDNELRIQLQKVKDRTLGVMGELWLDYDRTTGRFKCKGDEGFYLPNEIEPAF